MDLFRTISKYKKDRILNAFVIKAYAEIMDRNILVIHLHGYDEYFII